MRCSPISNGYQLLGKHGWGKPSHYYTPQRAHLAVYSSGWACPSHAKIAAQYRMGTNCWVSMAGASPATTILRKERISPYIVVAGLLLPLPAGSAPAMQKLQPNIEWVPIS